MLPEDESVFSKVVDLCARFLCLVTAQTGVVIAVEALATL
jgi:hypothetical protein